LSFCIQSFKQCVSITLQCALNFAIERKITLASDVCSRPPTTIRSHNLHAGDIREATNEIASYYKRDRLSSSLWALRAVRLLAFLWPPLFVFLGMLLAIILLKNKFKKKKLTFLNLCQCLVACSIPGKVRVSNLVSCCRTQIIKKL